MNYAETLQYLYNTLPMFSRMGSAAFKKDLTNTLILCERLGNPQRQFKTIHVAGTNGKGSVSHMLAAIFREKGSTTGLYTSPHLFDFRERIRVNGVMADEDFVVDFVQTVKPWMEEIHPSFFEITVAMAFTWFAKCNCDIAIIEVGLGGRLDSTNIITPELSVITNIGWDHMNMLGDTLPAIAAEKAGIIKQSIPVVVGERKEETESVFTNKAQEKQAPLFFADEWFLPVDHQWNEEGIRVKVKDIRQDRMLHYQLDLPGLYQVRNICTVLTAVSVLKTIGYAFSDQEIETALRQVKEKTGLHGRWEVIRKQPMVVLEVAHNPDGIRFMLQHLEQLRFNRLHLVLGMVKDKDINAVLKLLPPAARYYFTQADIPRALDGEQLALAAAAFGLKGLVYDHVNTALKAALQQSAPEDIIVVCGSIFLVGEVDQASVLQMPEVG